MAWYTSHTLRYRGRLMEVGSRYGCFNGAQVLRGKPLRIKEYSRDWKRLEKLFVRTPRIRQEISNFLDALTRSGG